MTEESNAGSAGTADLNRPELYLNRELSWLEFNQRVLDEARDPSVRLLERLKFLAITANNLDEFFEVRVAGLVDQRDAAVEDVAADRLTVQDQLTRIAHRTQRMLDEMSTCMRDELLPALEREHVHVLHPAQLDAPRREWLRRYFFEQVHPILTPLALDPGHPFPHVSNRSLHLVVMLSSERAEGEPAFAVVQVPRVLPRVVHLPSEGGTHTFVWLEDVVAEHCGELFRGFRRLGAWSFRVIRDVDVSIDEDDADDLLLTVEAEVRRRDRGRCVRLQIEDGAPNAAIDVLVDSLDVDSHFVFRNSTPLALQDVATLAPSLASRRDLREPPFVPVRSPAFPEGADVFECVSRGDVLLHHPYESFDPVVEFLQRSAHDPDVLAIKQTLYRTSGDSPIVDALIRAAENGKHVVVLVEVKARFDEANNIQWARKLESAGVNVVYGLVGLKTHAKVVLVVRREGAKLRRYVHLGTGNYNPSTARLYTDISFFTARAEFGEDATALFNLLTSCTAPETWRKLVVAPLGLHERILGLIEREIAVAQQGRPSRIFAKMNSLVDADVIHALYRASRAGVTVDLVVRGICCLRPGIPGVSERIRVRRIVDRFLEHARLFYFEADGAREVYASSADWMPRNFVRRIEVLFPIEAEELKQRAIDEILAYSWVDDEKASELLPDGTYVRIRPQEGAESVRSQRRFVERAQSASDAAKQHEREQRPFVVRPARQLPAALVAHPAAATSPSSVTSAPRVEDAAPPELVPPESFTDDGGFDA